MRGTTKILVLFGVIFVLVGGGIMFVIWRMTSSAMHSATRTRDPAAMMSTIGDTIVWTVVPIVLITAVGLVVFFVFVRRFMGANQRLVASGIPGTALVLDVRDTGVTINNINAVLEARLLVTIPGRAPYEATVEVTLGRMNWGALQAGMTVSVKVDPKHPARVAIDWGGSRGSGLAGMTPNLGSQVQLGGAAEMAVGAPGAVATPGGNFAIPGVSGAMQAETVRDAADVIAAGERAEATIQAVSNTGATAGQMVPNIEPEKAGDPMVFVAMQVQPRKAAAFAAQGIYRVPKHKLGALAIGRRVAVAYLPGQPQSATIDWSRV
ncbi:MAG TPA: hypothetical protein VIF14_02260 [Alphaproteobacteria bacterium]|jgi:hypothetical protein